jgi:hypothetical protein
LVCELEAELSWHKVALADALALIQGDSDELEKLRTELAEARRDVEALRARQFKPYPDGPMPGPFGWEVKS